MRIPQRIARLLPALLLATLVAGTTTTTTTTSSICANDPNDTIPDGCTSYATLEKLNSQIQPLVHSLTQSTDYFSYYRLDLYGRTCPFWSDDDGTCANIACSVTTIDDENSIPPIWRAEELSKLSGPKAAHPRKIHGPQPLEGKLGEDTEESCVVEADECDERDYCIPEDESVGSTGDYVSLIDNPERFTGYAGAGAANVWQAIYRENCFQKQKPEYLHNTPASGQHFLSLLQEKSNNKIVPSNGKPALADLELDDECLEKRVFYRLISGMHSSISMHLCWDYLNQTTGEWAPNLDCFVSRFAAHPERLQNIYFNYALLLRAVSKLRNYIPEYTFCSVDAPQDQATRSQLLALANAIPTDTEIFDEGIMFQDDSATLKDEFRNRFRNVSRVMDCVGCDKCRLWGKVQTQGYGTALKVLFEFDENKDAAENPVLRRTEMVALVNTLDRVSHSLQALQGFQKLWAERNATAAAAQRIEEVQEEEMGEEEEECEAAPGAPAGTCPHKDPDTRSVREVFEKEWSLFKDAVRHVINAHMEMPWLLLQFGKIKTKEAFDAVAVRASDKWDRLMKRGNYRPRRSYRTQLKTEL